MLFEFHLLARRPNASDERVAPHTRWGAKKMFRHGNRDRSV